MSEETYYFWWNADNDAVIQEEDSPYNYRALFYTKEAAIDFIKNWVQMYHPEGRELDHIMLRETTLPEDGMTAADAVEEILN